MTFVSSRTLAAALLAGAITLPFTSPVFAEDNMPKEAVIIVSGDADAAVAPDLAIVSLGVSETKQSAREALDANNKSMADVLKALKADGIADKDLQTSGFSIQPQYSYPQNEDGTPKPPVLTGYTVSNMLTARIRDLAKVGDVLDASVTLGVNQGGEIRFTNVDPEKTIEAARKDAMKNAIAKAETLAAAAGVKLGRVVEITENMQRPEPMPVMRMSMAKEASDSVPVASGENSYSVTVNVTFAIKQ
jgi:uncharacterized protein YggE